MQGGQRPALVARSHHVPLFLANLHRVIHEVVDVRATRGQNIRAHRAQKICAGERAGQSERADRRRNLAASPLLRVPSIPRARVLQLQESTRTRQSVLLRTRVIAAV